MSEYDLPSMSEPVLSGVASLSAVRNGNHKTLKPLRREPSLESVDWATPPELYDELCEEFKFDLDPCANEWRQLCPREFKKADNGLMQVWSGRVFMNPPYAWNVTGRWVHKALLESRRDEVEVVVGVLPVRTDTGWFHDFIYGQAEVRFIRGRVKFLKPDGKRMRPQHASMIVVWTGNE